MQTVIYKKINRLFEYLFALILFPIILLILFFIHAIRKWKHIRFGYFVSSRIGHFVADVGISFVEAKKSKGYLDFYFIPKPISNMQWYNMTCRNFNVAKIAEAFYRIDKIIFKNSLHRIIPPAERLNSRDKNGVLNSNTDLISFTKNENIFCKNWLKKRGWKEGEAFVSLMVRDSAYLQNYMSGRDFSYHNFRDTQINTYLSSVKLLVEMGYWVFRMGKVANERLDYNHERFVDYPFSRDQNDLLDVWLMAHSHFVISTGTGLDAVADIYRRPTLYLNLIPLSNINSWAYAITVPKYLKWKKTNKYLTFKEYLKNNYQHSEKYQEAGIMIENLSSEDISEAVLELESRLRGKWIETDEDKELQERFWKELKGWENFSKYHGWLHPEARVGSHFLNKVGSEFFN
ncbi:TIGR04372 family glycosyltransferase [Leptospira borgpetersenii]|uniref:Glycosyltransferase, TIGR04372 family n=1 Tax=Leptospira borgpetersenii serovar Javanica str. UI 09931 TaxID=1049767 RepID=A0AAV3J8L0_LEPBO|nr:TIGR04372 family glycosyltransferase [Leptospira borgpetersenii]AXX16260.1 TIGR04372 family glycosyltransferase [Leptospira borgpetersenii serovar Ceylonica]EPG56472.1 glycosyltransferase, TIGR04372 family [Leptospira borgpetersenii serovar Javanica str. UI 09931]MDQ7244334.1 TIGR04372 family glycosyltransferase [Leptospira borgpetersenii]PTM49726.1 putative glycosyltransferase (TIGR04372 family) [Leptospira borgpetersenii serovar Javanica]QVK49300.1 TIGR04372 family glycosyltransferase [Le